MIDTATYLPASAHRFPDVSGRIAVVSDLHKFSSVSDFSKGDNPFFAVYLELYKKRHPGERIAEPAKWSRAQMRPIEQEVRQFYPEETIKAAIAEIPAGRQAELRTEYDPQGLWERRQEIFREFQTAQHVVFNGDIFDIECCKNPQEKIADAVRWLKDRLAQAPTTNFHFVLGNHEAFLPFIKAMEKLEQDPECGGRFHFHEHYLQLGDCLWVHGDEQLGIAQYVQAYKTMNKGAKGQPAVAPEIAVEHEEGHRRRSLKELNPLARSAYVALNQLYHVTDNAWKGLPQIVRTLYDGIESSDREGLREAFAQSHHIFSGHTHQAYAVHYKDKQFYNGGASIQSRFAEFQPLRIDMQNGVATRVEPLLKRHREKAQQRLLAIPDTASQRYFVTSDLHIFAERLSRLEYSTRYYEKDAYKDPKVRQAIDRAIDEADVIVLNGDIFELFYTSNSPEAMEKSVQWLRDIAKTHPQKEIHFVLGNHEAVTSFVTAMEALARETNNFYFHEHAFQPNAKTAFLHGDEVVTGRFKPRNLYPPSQMQYSGLMRDLNVRGEATGMRFVKWLRHPETTASNVAQAIHQAAEIEHPEKLENIFIGHTHVPFVDTHKHGKWVTNTGSATNHSSYGGVTFTMTADGNITPPRVIDMGVGMGVVPTNYF